MPPVSKSVMELCVTQERQQTIQKATKAMRNEIFFLSFFFFWIKLMGTRDTDDRHAVKLPFDHFREFYLLESKMRDKNLPL